MDTDKDSQNPAQNQNDSQSVQADNTGDYNQYIDPDYKKKQKNKKIILFTALAVAALAVILAAVVLALFSSSDKNVPNETIDIVEACETKECFNEYFLLCQPARHTALERDGTIEYEVTGLKEVGCLVSMKYTDSEKAELIAKGMTCDLDNAVAFDESLSLAKEYPDDYECEGELRDYL